ncbi:MAG: hypothetical protein ACP5HK_01885 [Acidilobus sp.]
MRLVGEALGYRVEGDDVVVFTSVGEVRLRGSLKGTIRLRPGGARAAVALVISITVALGLLIELPFRPSWPFLIKVGYLGVLAAAAFGAYASIYSLLPRDALVVVADGEELAYILVGRNHERAKA